MKHLVILLFVFLSWSAQSQIFNTALSGDTWHIIKTRKQHLCTITASGEYAEQRVVVFLISGIWNTAEVTVVSEFNYDHKTMDLLWGYVGSGAGKYLAVKTSSITAGYVLGFTIRELENPNLQIELEVVDASLVTPISPQSTFHIDEHTKKIGIGTTTPSEKLSVNGTIRSKEVKVEAAPWPDYVFAEDYNLKSLEETETFIKENKRLPDMPSAEEVAKNGIALGEMNRLIVEKLEELTLHLIQLEKENQNLKKENEKIKTELSQQQMANSQSKLNDKVEALTDYLIELKNENGAMSERLKQLELKTDETH